MEFGSVFKPATVHSGNESKKALETKSTETADTICGETYILKNLFLGNAHDAKTILKSELEIKTQFGLIMNTCNIFFNSF